MARQFPIEVQSQVLVNPEGKPSFDDYQKELIWLGFVPLDYKRLVAQVNFSPYRRYVIQIEKLGEDFYRYSDHAYFDNKFHLVEFTGSSEQVRKGNRFFREELCAIMEQFGQDQL